MGYGNFHEVYGFLGVCSILWRTGLPMGYGTSYGVWGVLWGMECPMGYGTSYGYGASYGV